jgi:hypothetical protein
MEILENYENVRRAIRDSETTILYIKYKSFTVETDVRH